MNVKLKVFLFVLILAGIFASGVIANATQHPTEGTMDPPPGSSNIVLKNPLDKADNLYELIKEIVDEIILPIGAILVVVAIIYSGFLLVTAQGNEAKLETAKRAFLYTAIGTAILLGAWAIAVIIENTIKSITN